MDYASTLLELQADHERKCEAIGEAYRTEVLIPLCREHGLLFFSGNGDFWFCPKDTPLDSEGYWDVCNSSDIDFHRSGGFDLEYLRETIDTLHTEYAYDSYLGYLCASVFESDY